jgi:N-acetylmannosamine-6-phosphate 2-epimerase/N-acetylmannosamine kinase
VQACDLPVIGLIKRDFPDSQVRITALLEDVHALADAGAPIIAVDATDRKRPVAVAHLIAAIRARGRLAMADCADLAQMRAALAACADIVATTMSGYTGGKVPALPDLELVRAGAALGAPVFAEGRYHTPALAAAAIAAGARAVVVGTAITRPENVTSWYAAAIAEASRPAPTVLAVDIGGSKVSAAQVQGGVVLRRLVLPTSRDAGVEAWLRALADAVSGWPCDGVAAALSGVVRDGAWSAANPATLPVPDGFPIADRLCAMFGKPALAVNDAQAAAWGEYRHGAARHRDMAFVTVSSGIGGGIVLGGRLLTGQRGLAGSLGQIPWPGERLEAQASGFGIAAAARASGHGGDAAAVFASAARGEAWAGRVVDTAIRDLARGLATLHALVDPEVIVIGGGVGLASGMLERLRRAAEELPALLRPALVPAALGGDAGLIGAAALLAGSCTVSAARPESAAR